MGGILEARARLEGLEGIKNRAIGLKKKLSCIEESEPYYGRRRNFSEIIRNKHDCIKGLYKGNKIGKLLVRKGSTRLSARGGSINPDGPHQPAHFDRIN